MVSLLIEGYHRESVWSVRIYIAVWISYEEYTRKSLKSRAWGSSSMSQKNVLLLWQTVMRPWLLEKVDEVDTTRQVMNGVEGIEEIVFGV